MLKRTASSFGILVAVLALSATPAFAHYIASTNLTANCSGYSGTVTASALTSGDNYTISYTLTATCGGGATQTFTGSTSFTAANLDANGSETVTVSGNFSGSSLNGCYVTGTATMTDNTTGEVSPTVNLWINGNEGWPPGSPILSCSSSACYIPPSGTAIAGANVSWNGFKAPAGSVVWINAHLDAKSVPTNTITTVNFTGVTLVVHGTTYALPNGQVVFDSSVSTPTTVVNADGSWTTTVSPSFGGDIFFDGQAIPVDANMENGGGGNTGSTLSFSTSSSDNSFQFQWQWGAAVYTSWPGNAAANIEPVHGQLQAGAPQNTAVEKDLIQGPRGGGGSNFTGSWSGTGQGTCP